MFTFTIDGTDFKYNLGARPADELIQNEFISSNLSLNGNYVTTKLIVIPNKVNQIFNLVNIDNTKYTFLKARNGETVAVVFNWGGVSLNGNYQLILASEIQNNIVDIRNVKIKLLFIS